MGPVQRREPQWLQYGQSAWIEEWHWGQTGSPSAMNTEDSIGLFSPINEPAGKQSPSGREEASPRPEVPIAAETDPVRAFGRETIPGTPFEDPVEPREGDPMPPGVKLSEDLAPPHRPRVRAKDQEDGLEGSRRDIVHDG